MTQTMGRKTGRMAAVVLGLLLAPTAQSAEEFTLKDGRVLVGVYLEQQGAIECTIGTMKATVPVASGDIVKRKPVTSSGDGTGHNPPAESKPKSETKAAEEADPIVRRMIRMLLAEQEELKKLGVAVPPDALTLVGDDIAMVHTTDVPPPPPGTPSAPPRGANNAPDEALLDVRTLVGVTFIKTDGLLRNQRYDAYRMYCLPYDLQQARNPKVFAAQIQQKHASIKTIRANIQRTYDLPARSWDQDRNKLSAKIAGMEKDVLNARLDLAFMSLAEQRNAGLREKAAELHAERQRLQPMIALRKTIYASVGSDSTNIPVTQIEAICEAFSKLPPKGELEKESEYTARYLKHLAVMPATPVGDKRVVWLVTANAGTYDVETGDLSADSVLTMSIGSTTSSATFRNMFGITIDGTSSFAIEFMLARDGWRAPPNTVPMTRERYAADRPFRILEGFAYATRAPESKLVTNDATVYNPNKTTTLRMSIYVDSVAKLLIDRTGRIVCKFAYEEDPTDE